MAGPQHRDPSTTLLPMGAGWGWRPHAARNVAVPASQRHTARGQHELKVGAWAHSGGQFPIFVAEQDGEEPAD